MTERPESLIKKADSTMPKAKKMNDAAKEAILNIYLFQRAATLEVRFYRNTVRDLTRPIFNILQSNLLIDEISGSIKNCTLTPTGVAYVETNFAQEIERELGYMNWGKARIEIAIKERALIYDEIKNLTGRESNIKWYDSAQPEQSGWEIEVFLPCDSKIEIDHRKGEYTLDTRWMSKITLETWEEIDQTVRKMLVFMKGLPTRLDFPPVEDFLPKKEEEGE